MMTDFTQSQMREELDRFARGELSPVEARELAQESLESPFLFEDLTAIALAKTAVASVPVPAEPTRRAWWRVPMMVATTASLVVGAVAFLYFEGQKLPIRHHADLRAKSEPAATASPLKPTITFSATSSQPMLLASDLEPRANGAPALVFRGQTESSRAPRQVGSIISIKDGLATVDLGSLDGLARGSELEVLTKQTLGAPVAHLRIATVFREEARAPLPEVVVKLHSRVRISDSIHLAAVLEQVEAYDASGHLTDARRIAGETDVWLQTAKLSPHERAAFQERSAQLDFRAGALDSAELQYRMALKMLSADPRNSPKERVTIANDLASVAMLRGDYDLAEESLKGIIAAPVGTTPGSILNNLGVLAEIRGSPQQAQTYYDKALESTSETEISSRMVVQANMARIKGSH
jgi:Flp pilus assembly protein TadD